MAEIENHKRVRLESTQVAALKKQKLSSSGPNSPSSTSNLDQEDEADVNAASFDADHHSLELFRKEAIWREMQEYKRKYNRATDEISILSAQRVQQEARLSAVDISWNLLVHEADLLLPSTSTLKNGHSHSATSPSISDPSLTADELEEALQQRSNATKALLGRLTSFHPSESSSEKVEELTESCRSLLDQSLRTQESLRLLRAQHDATLLQLETTHTDLLKAEKALDRAQSITLNAIAGTSTPKLPLASPDLEAQPPFPNGGSDTPMNIDGVEPLLSSVGTAESIAAMNAALQQVEELKEIAQRRASDIEELRTDRVNLKMEIDRLKVKLIDVPEEIIVDSVPFKLLQSYITNLSADLESKRGEVEQRTTEANEIREMQEKFRTMVCREAADQVDEIQKRLILREGDLTRIRSQREDFRAELMEVRAKESEKGKAGEMLRVLALTREDRLAAYSSEVRRLKMQLAAREGDAVTMDLYAAKEQEDIVKELQGRLKSVEDLLLLLRDQLRNYTSVASTFDAQTLVHSETEARKELAVAKERLAILEDLLGEGGAVEVKELAERVLAGEKRVQVLELEKRGMDLATNMLYAEIDRLSTAWATLDEQNGNKVFNLVTLEEKVQRLITEKAKADTKYFTAMRQKDIFQADSIGLNKLVEKQQKALESSSEIQNSVGVQLTAAEKEITLQQRHVLAYREKLDELTKDKAGFGLRHQGNLKHLSEVNALLSERVSQTEEEISNRKRVEEELIKVRNELMATRSMASSSSSIILSTTTTASTSNSNHSNEVKELKKYNEDLSKMLKCSTCNLRFKGVILNRCGHLFCKECVDARLNVRARKCPTCQAPFGKDDVSSVFF